MEQDRAVNVQGTQNVAAAALEAGARMLHVSSVDALGVGHRDAPADEDSSREGKIPCTYVVTKREAEAVVRSYIDRGLDAVIVNPGFMLGPWDWKPSSGRMLLEVATRFTPLGADRGIDLVATSATWLTGCSRRVKEPRQAANTFWPARI